MSSMKAMARVLPLLAAVALASGCANYEVNTKRGNIPGKYIRYELQEADRAVETARKDGKEQNCPAEFKAAEAAKNNAYDVFRACNTEEGAALAKKATAMANALCPPKKEVVIPPPPAPPAPTAKISIAPGSVTKGQSAKMTWSSQNATECAIQPGIGAVALQGSMTITPADNTAYTLLCKGAGGSADSAANIAVAAPIVAAAQPKAAPAKLCSPTVINVQFDTNKFNIKQQYHDELKKLADFLAEFPKAKGVIEGHTDNVGNMSSNMKLSQNRADSVRSYLVKNLGVAPERVSAKGFGPTKPIASNKTKEGKQQNRRIESNFNCE